MSSHHLLIDLEAEVRKGSPQSTASATPPLSSFAKAVIKFIPEGTIIHSAQDFDWTVWMEFLDEVLADNDGNHTDNPEYWVRELQHSGYIIFQLPESHRR